MLRKLGGLALVAALASLGTYLVQRPYVEKIKLEAKEARDRAESVQEKLIGYTKYTDYLSAGAKVLTGQTKLLTASVERTYDWVRVVERDMVIFKSTGTAIIRYHVTYSFGFDLAESKFDIAQTADGIQIRVGKPILVAPPAAKLLSWQFPSVGLLTDEKTAALELFKRVPEVAEKEGNAMAADETIRALCEKRLIDFLRDFLSRQPGVKAIPNITIAYRP